MLFLKGGKVGSAASIRVWVSRSVRRGAARRRGYKFYHSIIVVSYAFEALRGVRFRVIFVRFSTFIKLLAPDNVAHFFRAAAAAEAAKCAC